ncbi:MFS general substrate transporter [Cucurbitaria berberidis CBS 394.84]|uniref:MFS general substrate transporter n=1 Tax=Cucurbitaria berberidis CBS 394.84 TaxID=1168544 RepID=A0A9P4L5C4_9PLEO|nr:MFS general substrate transporter [Cucurbitaria berberidis CBS 394.84]KAF1842811.1 MFS general substrate transporter [Cucurbitaria berberidis CBS 394.84]
MSIVDTATERAYGWGAMALFQCTATNFAGMLVIVIRLLLGAFEAGFFTAVVFYLTLFYTRGELGFRIALFFSSALLSGAFSGLISFAVFRIEHTIPGWKWLCIIEAERRTLRDPSSTGSHDFNVKSMFKDWKDWKMMLWCIIAFTYPVAFATTSNFLPQIVQCLGYSVVTNLWAMAPNTVGFVVLSCICYSSDYFRERTLDIVLSLCISLVGLIIPATIDVLHNKSATYFACFMLASSAYIPSCLVHCWHNNNNLHENARASTTGLLVGLGNLGGILTAATFRSQYAPKYVPTLIATAACNITCICFTMILGGVWMKTDNRRRDN